MIRCEEGPANNLWPIGLGRYARHALDIMLGETYQQPQVVEDFGSLLNVATA